jgi:hypothetical protein
MMVDKRQTAFWHIRHKKSLYHMYAFDMMVYESEIKKIPAFIYERRGDSGNFLYVPRYFLFFDLTGIVISVDEEICDRLIKQCNPKCSVVGGADNS